MDVPSVFLHTPMDPKDPKFHKVLQVKLAEIMVKVDTNLCRKFSSTDIKGSMILCLEMQKSPYGILKSMLLFYLNMVGYLEISGFKLNPYDPCMMNKIVGGEQMTVVFQVGDLKVLHKSKKSVTKVIDYLGGIYPVLKAVFGGMNNYLGMRLDYLTQGQVGVSRTPYMKKY